MRKTQFVPEEIYHLCGRGNEKQKLFLDARDYARFLFLILYFQGNVSINHISGYVSFFVKRRAFDISKKLKDKLLAKRTVELVAFAIMPNHFHIIVEESEENGISEYMQRVLTAYAKYFNTKYKKSGHVFQGPFRAVHIEDNEQLMYTSAYVHRNPREIKGWKHKEHTYLWSSYQDYLGENRWGEFLKPDIILEQYGNTNEYKKDVDGSGAKDFSDELMNP